LKSSLKKSYQGTENAHKAMVLFGDMEAKQFGFNQKDLDFNEQLKFSRDKILGIFRVPKAILSQTDGVNLANAKTAIEIYQRFTIKPKMERIIQQLNEFYVPMFEGTENQYLDFTSPVSDDQNEKLSKYDSGIKNGWLTINEVRSFEGLEPIPGFDVPHLPQNLAPLSANGGTVTPDKSIKAKGDRVKQLNSRKYRPGNYDKIFKDIKEDIKKKLVSDLKNQKIKKQKIKFKAIEKKIKEEDAIADGSLSSEERKEWWVTKNAMYEKYQIKVEKKQSDIFQTQEKQTLKKLRKQIPEDKRKEALLPVNLKKDDIDINDLLLDEEKESKKTTLLLTPILLALFKASGNETYDLINLPDEEIDMTGIKSKITRDVKLMAKGVTETTNIKMQKAIEAGIRNNEGVNDITIRIKNIFTEASNARAKLISETETARYTNQSTEKSFIDSGVIEAKQWQTNPGACPICVPLDGKTVDLGTLFFEKGDSTITTEGNKYNFDYSDVGYPPAHPRCRCFIAPVFIKAKTIEKPKTKTKTKTVTIRQSSDIIDEYNKKIAELNDEKKKITESNSKLEKEKIAELEQIQQKKMELDDIRVSLLEEENNKRDNE